MLAADATAHARALLLSGRCPACAELLGPGSLFASAPCSSCDAVMDRGLTGGSLAERVEARGRRRLLAIVITVALAQLLLGWIPLVGALALIVAVAWIRVGILQPTTAMLSPRRRVLTRWTARLLMAAAVAVTVIVIEALTLVPVLGLPLKAALGAAQVALAAWSVTRYTHWQLRREAEGRPIAAAEWAVLAAAFSALIGAVLGLAYAFVALAAAFDQLLGLLGGGP